MKRAAAIGACFLILAGFAGVARAEGEIECAQFDEKGAVTTEQKTAEKDTKEQTQVYGIDAKAGKENLKTIQQKSPWTSEEVKIKDGKMQITSTCGEKGKYGSVTVCIETPARKQICGVKIPKDSRMSDRAIEAATGDDPVGAMSKLALGNRHDLADKIKFLDPGLLADVKLNSADLKKIGIPEDWVPTVQKALKDYPEESQKLLTAIAKGDVEATKKILSDNNVGYVADVDVVAKNAVKMYADPTKLASAFSDEAQKELYNSDFFCGVRTACPAADVPPTLRSPAAGFDESSAKRDELPPRGSGVAAKVGPLVEELTGHGCQNNNLSCRTNNPGAMTYASWMQKYGGVECGERNNTACFPSIEAGIAAKADLVIRRISQGCDSLYTVLETCRYSSVRDGNDSYAYAVEVGNRTGVGAHGRLDPQNAEQIGRLLTGMAWYEGGRGIAFSAEQLERGLKAYYGTDTLPAGDPNFRPGTSWSSLASGGGFRVGMGEFFENKFSAGSAWGGFSNLFGSFLSPYSGNAAPLNPLQPSATIQSPAIVPQSAPVLVPSVKLSAYPTEVRAGTSVRILWSAAGVSTASPCTLYEWEGSNRSARHTQNAGVYTKTAVIPPKLIFTLECTPVDSRAEKNAATARLEIPVK